MSDTLFSNCHLSIVRSRFFTDIIINLLTPNPTQKGVVLSDKYRVKMYHF